MKPSSLSIFAMPILSLDAGTSTESWRASTALRTLVSISAIGSDIQNLPAESLPTGFQYTRQLPRQGPLPKTDTAKLELTDESPGTAADSTPAVLLCLVLWLPKGFLHFREFGQERPP